MQGLETGSLCACMRQIFTQQVYSNTKKKQWSFGKSFNGGKKGERTWSSLSDLKTNSVVLCLMHQNGRIPANASYPRTLKPFWRLSSVSTFPPCPLIQTFPPPKGSPLLDPIWPWKACQEEMKAGCAECILLLLWWYFPECIFSLSFKQLNSWDPSNPSVWPFPCVCYGRRVKVQALI